MVLGGPGTVTNSGVLSAYAATAVQLSGGGNVTNLSGGLITATGGSLPAVQVSNGSGAATITNYGTISGSEGVYAGANAAQTLIDSGTIIGSGGTAVALGAGTGLVQFRPGNLLMQGTVTGGGSSELEFASGASTGTLDGIGASFINFATGTVDTGASWELTGSNTFTGSAALTDSGTLINAGSLSGDKLSLSGGQLTNLSGGVITSAYIYGVSGTTDGVVNQGTIDTPNTVSNYAVLLKGQGNLSNAAGALIAVPTALS